MKYGPGKRWDDKGNPGFREPGRTLYLIKFRKMYFKTSKETELDNDKDRRGFNKDPLGEAGN
jgi:hypothetical protein